MSDLTLWETGKFERLLEMDTGYVLDLPDRTFAEFVLERTVHNIEEPQDQVNGRSKAKRMWGILDKGEQRHRRQTHGRHARLVRR